MVKMDIKLKKEMKNKTSNCTLPTSHTSMEQKKKREKARWGKCSAVWSTEESALVREFLCIKRWCVLSCIIRDRSFGSHQTLKESVGDEWEAKY